MDIRKIIQEEIDGLQWIDDTPIGDIQVTHLSLVDSPNKDQTLEEYLLVRYDSRFITIVRDDDTIVDILCDGGYIMLEYFDNFLQFSGDFGEELRTEAEFLAHWPGSTEALFHVDGGLYDILLRLYPNTKSIHLTIV